MADASRFSIPHSWGDAFAALPLEAPPMSRWPDVAAQLNAPHNTGTLRGRTWLALAASLFVFAALPAAWILRDAPGDTTRAQPPITTPIIAKTPAATAPSSGDIPSRNGVMPDIKPASGAVATTDHRAAMGIEPAARATSPQRAVSAHRQPARERRVPTTRIAIIPSNPANSSASLESLYAASAQLETLLSLARDVRVESAPAAALAGAFDADLATIDAQLAQPGLPAGEQLALWQARVETLQQSAGFESHLRLLAADGKRLDGALVSVD